MKYLLLFPLLVSLIGCTDAKDKAKNLINKGGEVVGRTAGEFVEGVSEGIEKTLERDLIVSKQLSDQGIEIGKVVIADDSLGNSNNILTVYTIFNKDFKGKLTAKNVDKSGKESGRAIQEVTAKAGEAKYIDFGFDKRTHIDVKSTINLD